MNKLYFNENKQDAWKCYWLIYPKIYMEIENEIMILIEENKRGEERYRGVRRESSESTSTKVPLWSIYTHTFSQVGA